MFVALGIQHAMCMRLFVICDLPALQYFSTLSRKWHDFRKKEKFIEHKFVFRISLQILSETFLIPRRNKRDMTNNVHRSSCKVPVILVTS